MNHRLSIFAAFGLGLVGFGLWWTSSNVDGPSATTPAAVVASVRSPHPVGASWRADVALHETIELPGGAPIDLQLRGALRVIAAAPQDGELRRIWSLEGASLAMTQAGGPVPAADAATADLARAFGVAYDARGRLVALYVPADGETLASGMREQLAALLQVDTSNEASWDADEIDPVGTARVRYVRQGERLTRTREAYVSVVAGGVDDVRGEARAVATVGADGWLDRLEASDMLVRRLNTDGLEARVTLSLRVERADGELRGAPTWDAGWVRVVPGQGLATASARDDLEARVLGGATLDQLLATLLEAKGIDRARVARRIAALLRIDPSQVAVVRASIPALSAADAGIVMQGLAQSGVSGAQAAVADVLRGDARADVRHAAAVELALSGAYDAQAVAGLQAGMTDADPAVRDASQLALGAQVRAGGDPALLRGVVEGFDPKADDARTRLRALGNSGVDATLDVALKALEAGDEGVRRAALEALRHVDVPVDDALWEGFGDTNPEVRLAAVRAAEAAGGAAADGLTDLAANDPSASVRAEALRALVSRRDDESVRETATALRSDSDPGVRAAAAALLAPATP